MIHETATIHEHSLVEPGAEIGPHTRVWAFAHVLPGTRIGTDCNICDHVFIEADVTVGDRVTVQLGVQLWDGLTEKGSDPFTRGIFGLDSGWVDGRGKRRDALSRCGILTLCRCAYANTLCGVTPCAPVRTAAITAMCAKNSSQ